MLIGLAGRKGVGKDTSADYLVVRRGFVRESFAAPLKEVVAVVFGVDRAAMDDPARKEVPDANGLTPRRLMQVVGTELFRRHLPQHLPSVGNVWVESMRRRLKAHLAAGRRVVVTDVRFEDEARLVTEMGGVILLVERDTGASDSHASEALDIPAHLFHATVDNKGDLGQLYDRIDQVWVTLRAP